MPNKLKYAVFSILIFCCAMSSYYFYSQSTIRHAVDAYLTECTHKKLFSGSILMAREGKVIIRKGYGMANYELNIANSSETKFRLASLTKQFTAFAIIQLTQKKLLSVTNTLDSYIPDYPHGNEITIQHLLMHTSGVVNFTDLPEYNEIKNSSIVNIQDIITLFKNKPLGFKPGSQYEYSNSGYILLSHIIEKVSKKTYADYINENVFKPLNMNNSGYDQSELTLENRASGYILFSEKNSFESKEISIHKASCLNMQIPLGAGGLYSTVEDLFIWSQLLHSGDKAVSALIDSTIFMNNDPKKASSMSYGYGIIVDTDYSTSHKKIIFHNGEIDGFSSIMMQIVDENITIIILSNFEHADINTIANNIAGIILCK